jgi:uncharacterized membrane protein YkvA (DUF1232 family)
MIKVTFGRIKNHIKKYIALAKDLKKDKRVPRISKVLIVLAVAYFFMPFDLIPDFIPVIGYLDDAVIVPSLIFLAFKFVPKGVYSDHYKRIFKE